MGERDLRDLRELVGLGRHCSEDELRIAYDQAMQRATRAGDLRHATRLSAAFDALPAASRSKMFPSGGAAAATRAAAGGAAWRSSPVRAQSWAPAPIRKAPRRRRWRTWTRRLAYVLVAAIVIVVAVPTLASYEQWRRRNDVPAQVPVPQVGPAGAEGGYGPPRMIPLDAPVGSTGLASIVCQPESTTPGYLITAPPGTIVACRNGALPRVLG